LDRLGPQMLRHRCTTHISGAEAHAGAGALDAACADAQAALDLVDRVQHRETLRRVGALHRNLRSNRTPLVRALGEHLMDTRVQMETAA